MSIPADPIVNLPLVTPFDDRDRVDLGAVGRNVRRWMGTAATGFLVGSQTGEEWHLSEDEKLDVARTVAEHLEGDRYLMGGIDCPSVTETLRRAEAFAAVGAELLRVRIPRSAEVIEPYFREVLPRCPVPVLLMHQCDPARFGLAADPAGPPELLAAVAEMDNVFGYVTDHDVRFEARVRRRITVDRRFWICNGSLILHGTLIGCNGTTTAIANVWPDALDELLRRGTDGDYHAARPLQESVARLDEVLLPYRAVGVKAALRLLGFEGMVPRSPTPEVPARVVEELERLLGEFGVPAPSPV